MKIVKLTINNFMGIKNAEIYMDGHTVFVGDNNVGKSSIFEAINLVLGPDRLSQHPVVDEHDFFAGEYLNCEEGLITIFIEVILTDLDEDQLRRFANFIEWWDINSQRLISEPPANEVDSDDTVAALRICFKGQYDIDDDDFVGQTFFSSSHSANSEETPFKKADKRVCGFLYLRTLRTGSRALSLEHGSLLDIILTLNEIHPQMWEEILSQLDGVSVANNPELGIVDILNSVQDSLHKYISCQNVDNPIIKVSNFTREHLRKILTVYLDSGIKKSDGTSYFTPYYHQGTGTINVLVLSLLSIIADIKKKVIFAMEEPETALPPYIQKQIIHGILTNSSQALFTTHSPYVLEEFPSEDVLVISNNNGELDCKKAKLPPAIKQKAYREELKKRFCESLLSSKVLIVEGRTEFDVFTSVARKLAEIDREKYSSLELLGFAVVNAETDSQVAPLGKYYRELGKKVVAIFDKQTDAARDEISSSVDYFCEANEHGIEKVVVKGVNSNVIKRYAIELVDSGLWPVHLSDCCPSENNTDAEIEEAMFKYFKHKKGDGALADFILSCNEDEMPEAITLSLSNIKTYIESLATCPTDIINPEDVDREVNND